MKNFLYLEATKFFYFSLLFYIIENIFTHFKIHSFIQCFHEISVNKLKESGTGKFSKFQKENYCIKNVSVFSAQFLFFSF